MSLALHQAKTDNQRTGQSEVSKDQSEAMITADKGHGGRMAFYGRENSFFLPTETLFIMLFAFNDGGNFAKITHAYFAFALGSVCSKCSTSDCCH